MKEMIGKSCLIEISRNGKALFYKAKEVLDVTDTHITFLDKYNNQYTYRLMDVAEISHVSDKA
jgi:hypothetical protein